MKLPVEFQSELDFSGQARQSGEVAQAGGSAIVVEDPGVAVTAIRLWRHEVGVVKDIKDLSSELNVEGFRDARDRERLVNREVHVHKIGAVQLIPADVKRRQIGAVVWLGGVVSEWDVVRVKYPVIARIVCKS